MSTPYGGQPANIAAVPTPAAPVAIASSTHATPIVITSGAPHLLNPGDEFIVNDHAVNTAANGTWIAGAVGGGGTTVVLLGSVGNGVGAASGTTTSMACGTPAVVTSDGDPEAAVSVDVALETLFDRTAFLFGLVGWKQHVYKGGTLTVDADATLAIAASGELEIAAGATFQLGTGVDPAYSPARSITRIQHGFWAYTPADFHPVVYTGAEQRGIESDSFAGASAMYFLRIPHGATLTAVAVQVKGPAGQSTIAATLPSISIFKVAAGVVTTLATGSDASGTLAAYKLQHQIVLGVSEVIDRTTYAYGIFLTDQQGANAVAGTGYGADVRVVYTTSRLDED